MPQIVYNITADFSDQGDSVGWSEHYGLTAEPTQVYDSIFAFVRARLRCLHTDYSLRFTRASDLLKQRDAIITTNSFSDGRGLYGGTSAAEPWSRLLWRLFSSTTQWRPLYMGGLPESIITPPRFYNRTAGWIPVKTAFANFLTSRRSGQGTWSNIFQVYVTPGNPQPISDMRVFPASPFYLQVTTLVSPANIAVGSLVAIRGLRRNRQIERYLRVAAINNPNVYVLGPFRKPVGVSWAAGGTIGVVEPRDAAIANCYDLRIVKRAVGRPFDLLHGRQAG